MSIKLDDPKLDVDAYITDEIELYRVVRHEEIGLRLYVENAHGHLEPGSLIYHNDCSYLSDDEVCKDFRLAQISPSRKILATVQSPGSRLSPNRPQPNRPR